MSKLNIKEGFGRRVSALALMFLLNGSPKASAEATTTDLIINTETGVERFCGILDEKGISYNEERIDLTAMDSFFYTTGLIQTYNSTNLFNAMESGNFSQFSLLSMNAMLENETDKMVLDCIDGLVQEYVRNLNNPEVRTAVLTQLWKLYNGETITISGANSEEISISLNELTPEARNIAITNLAWLTGVVGLYENPTVQNNFNGLVDLYDDQMRFSNSNELCR